MARRTEGASALTTADRESLVASIAGLALAAAGIVALSVLGEHTGGYWLALIIPAMLPLALLAAVCWKVIWGA